MKKERKPEYLENTLSNGLKKKKQPKNEARGACMKAVWPFFISITVWPLCRQPWHLNTQKSPDRDSDSHSCVGDFCLARKMNTSAISYTMCCPNTVLTVTLQEEDGEEELATDVQ